MAGRSFETEAVVLRSIRYGEADRILHLFSPDRGRLGAIAKGARKSRSRFGARLEPPSRIKVRLHKGRGDLATVTGVDLVASNDAVRRDHRRSAIATVGMEAAQQLFAESDPSERAYQALVRFLEVLGDYEAVGSEPGIDPLALSFQFKLLWVAGLAPNLDACTACGDDGPLAAFSVAAGGALCDDCRDPTSREVSGAVLGGIRALLETPLADASQTAPDTASLREMLVLLEGIHSYHGGFRLRSLAR